MAQPLAVRGARLQAGGRLTAEVGGRLVGADVLGYSPSPQQEVLCLWTSGSPSASASSVGWPVGRLVGRLVVPGCSMAMHREHSV